LRDGRLGGTEVLHEMALDKTAEDTWVVEHSVWSVMGAFPSGSGLETPGWVVVGGGGLTADDGCLLTKDWETAQRLWGYGLDERARAEWEANQGSANGCGMLLWLGCSV
jgi:hypothetical protein